MSDGRVIMVGAGEVAESYWLPGAAMLRRPVVVLDLDGERAQALAARSGPLVDAAASLGDAAPRNGDIVVVATPPGSHGAVVREAVGAGAQRLIVEKPPFTSAEDMDATLQVLSGLPTAAGVAFIRRAWRPIATARRLYPRWQERFGALVRARITEGRPYAWSSRAVAERGIAGLSSMLLDEVPHALDALWGIAGWEGAPPVEVRSAALDPLEVDVDAVVGGVELRILGSRIAQLPTALDLAFERGAATVEMAPNGGIVVRDEGGERTLIRCGGMSTDVESMFAGLLTRIAAEPLSASPNGLETWRGPMALIERVQERG